MCPLCAGTFCRKPARCGSKLVGGSTGPIITARPPPRAGDVLVFRSTGRLPSGHVSVVKQVRNSRLVLVDHANWEPGEVTHRAPVVDVSPNNNWTRVRVWWSPIHAMGKTVYPVYGFIEPTGTGGS